MNQENRQDVKVYQNDGWELWIEEDKHLILRRKRKQSAIIHVLLLLSTGGFGNIVYFLLKCFPETKRIIK